MCYLNRKDNPLAGYSKSVDKATEKESVMSLLESVSSRYWVYNKHVWDLYQVCNEAIKEGTQHVNGLDGFSLLVD